MKQADLGLNLSTKRTRKREFLDEMNRVVPWAALGGLVTPHAPAGRRGRPPFPVETMLRIHFMQQWFGLSDPAMEEALFDVPLYREFALIRARTVDTFGNLRFYRTARNFSPIMATAARTTVVEADRLVDVGAIDPDDVHLSGLYVHRVVHVPEHEDPFEYKTSRKRPEGK